MASVKELRGNAEQCTEWARTARSQQEREIFLQMARTWLEVATRRERTEKRPERNYSFGESL